MAEAVRVFFSYSHEDEKLRDKLAQHLSILKREGIIAEWHDRQIGAGTEWANEIDTQLNNADIILLLISASFLSSDYCWGVELKRAMARHEAGEACVIPVILRPVDWKGAPFGKLQAFPKDALPVTKWQDQDEALMNVVAGIRQAVERLQTVRQQTYDKLIPSVDNQATRQARETGQEETLYRQDVQNCLQEDGGEFSPISRVFLDGLRDSLSLSPDRAAAIELELLKPYQTYVQTLKGMMQQEYPLSATNEDRLKRLQQTLALTDEAVKAIDRKIARSENARSSSSTPSLDRKDMDRAIGSPSQSAPQSESPKISESAKAPAPNPVSPPPIAQTPATPSPAPVSRRPQPSPSNRPTGTTPQSLFSQSENPISSRSVSPTSQSPASRQLNRQQFLKWLILAGGGVAGVTIASQFWGEQAKYAQVDYSKLEGFLKTKQWKDADLETKNLMLKVANREQQGYLDNNSIYNFPCDVLSQIDRLWVDNSGGKFGFSVQKKIYFEDCGGKPDGQYDEKAYDCFANAVGWLVNNQWIAGLNYVDTTAQVGHLPSFVYLVGTEWEGGRGVRILGEVGRFFSHAEACKL